MCLPIATRRPSIPMMFMICHDIIHTFWLEKSHVNLPSLVLLLSDHSNKLSPKTFHKWSASNTPLSGAVYQEYRDPQHWQPSRDKDHRSSHRWPLSAWAGGSVWGGCWVLSWASSRAPSVATTWPCWPSGCYDLTTMCNSTISAHWLVYRCSLGV